MDFVYNLASPASPIDYAQLPIETLRVGSIGTENGLELARAKKAVFLQASTSDYDYFRFQFFFFFQNTQSIQENQMPFDRLQSSDNTKDDFLFAQRFSRFLESPYVDAIVHHGDFA